MSLLHFWRRLEVVDYFLASQRGGGEGGEVVAQEVLGRLDFDVLEETETRDNILLRSVDCVVNTSVETGGQFVEDTRGELETTVEGTKESEGVDGEFEPGLPED
jgi:hypothetical protein